MSNPTYIEKYLTWRSGIKILPNPWSDFTFLSEDLQKGEFSVGNQVANFNFNTAAINDGIKTPPIIKTVNTGETAVDYIGPNKPTTGTPARIGAIVYNTDITPSKTNSGDAVTAFNKELGAVIYADTGTASKSKAPYPIGFILVDEAGEIIAVPLGGDSGTASFYVEVTDTTDQDILCFFKLVWQEQCDFAQCVSKYVQLLQFGAAPCDALDELMNKRRALEILNCYDVRDIPNNTTDYNILTYTQIKKLLNT